MYEIGRTPMTEGNCTECSVTVAGEPGERDMHEVQETVEVGGEVFCQACANDEYVHTGDQVVRAAAVDIDNDELAELLTDTLQAQELRTWMSAQGLQRSRGSNKTESAEQAVEQDRTLVAATLDEEHALAEDGGDFSVTCQNCGLEEWYGSAEAAEDAAENHKSNNSTHFPIAWGPDGRRIYG